MNTSSIVRAVIAAAGLWVAYQGYNGQSVIPTPGPSPVVVVPDGFPNITLTAGEESILSKLPPILPEDALVLARASRDWSDDISRDVYITNLGQFANIHSQLWKSLLVKTGTATRLAGKVSPTIKDLYFFTFADLVDDSGVKSVEITPVERAKLARFFAVLSVKFASIAGVK